MSIEDRFGGKMPVGAWGSPPPGHINDENYRAVKECGIDFLCTLYELGDVELNRQALAAAERAGIGLFLNDRSFFFEGIPQEEGERKIAAYRKYKSFLGIDLCDEPGSCDFGKIAELMRAYAPAMGDSRFYINLMPMYAKTGQLARGCCFNEGHASPEEYARYITAFADTVPTEMLSYDFYPFRKGFGWMDGNYFRQLSLGKKQASRMGVPLWVFIQATSWMREEIRTMTETEILWQVAASLAYGVRGIQYFTYITPVDDSSEYFGEAMVDRCLRKTPLYTAVQNANRHIAAVGPALMRYRHAGVLAAGALPAEVPKEDILSGFGIGVTGENYLAGCYVGERGRALYVMNPSFTREAVFRVTQEAGRRLFRRGADGARTVESGAAVRLGAGQGALFEEEIG